MRYGLAFVATAIALSLRCLLDPMVGDDVPFVTFYFAVLGVAWYGGLGPALLTAGLSMLAAAYFFLTPRYDLSVTALHRQIETAGFLSVGLGIGVICELLRRARLRAERENIYRRHLEEELRHRADELVQADRRKDEFLAMLGHELRNPLAALFTSVELAKQSRQTTPPAFSERLERQCKQLLRLVDDLLDVSRLIHGKIRLQKEWVEVSSIVRATVESCRPMLNTRRHNFVLAPLTEPRWVNGDPVRLVQVLSNLLTNAAKYTPSGGQVSLVIREEVDQVVFRVTDNGIGIPPELLPHVFDLFVQGKQSLARSGGGLGIGLALVKQLVEMHNGSVSASSPGDGGGSIFVVRLPATRVPPPARPPAAGRKPDRSRRILIVEDNKDVAEEMELLLRCLGHEVSVAPDGPAALALAPTIHPEVVLVDIGLPGMNGWDLGRMLRQAPGLRDVRIVAVTCYGSEEDRRRSREAGFAAHLVKPVGLQLLQEATADVS
jgi:signal transduction histidine kinase/CheY-like chemotaxis protein